MAASNSAVRLSPVNFGKNASKTEDAIDNLTKEWHTDIDLCDDFLVGSKLEGPQLFKTKKGKDLTLTPLIVDFRRVLLSKSPTNIVPEVCNKDLLHAVIGLYDTALSEMTPDVLYASVCDKWARTIILLRDVKETLDDINDHPENTAKVDEKEDDNMEAIPLPDPDIFEAQEDPPGIFAGLYSDDGEEMEEPDDTEDEEDEEDEEFSHGIHAFLKRAHKRKHLRKKESKMKHENVGIESRIVAAATFEKTYCKPNEKIIHLTLIGVRNRYRKMGIGKHLLMQVKNMSVVGQYDACVVHADNSALDFFERYGFSDDLILNSRWSELAEQYTNCTLMSYMPPFTNQQLSSNSIPELDIIAMDKEIKKWRDKNLDAYRAEVSCVNRMRHEIVHLRVLVSSQQDVISKLVAECEKARLEKFAIEKNFLEYRLSTAKTVLSSDNDDDGDEMGTLALIQALQAELHLDDSNTTPPPSSPTTRPHRYQLSDGKGNNNQPYDHGKDTQEFYEVTKQFYAAMKKDCSVVISYEVKMVSKALLDSGAENTFQERLRQLVDPGMVVRLYYCGSLERPSRLTHILKYGFSSEDFSPGDYGLGLYFSKYPSRAAQFSAIGKLLVVDVGLGCSQTVVKKERTRTAPEDHTDSILTPGRLLSSGDNDGLFCQEYVVFDAAQANPVYLIEYGTTGVPAS